MIPLLHHSTIVLVGASLVGAVLLGTVVILLYPPARNVAGRVLELLRPGNGERRRCRYCFLGQSHLHEETVRLDGDDLVEIRCWVCTSCGLPQWTIMRTAVLKKAA